MKHTTVWIDHQRAYIIECTTTGIQDRSIEKEEKGKMDHEHLKRFYHKVAMSLANPDQLLILGPGTAKNEFKHHCEQHGHADLKNAIVGIETMKDHPSKSEMIEVSRKFFNQYFTWHVTEAENLN